MGQGEAGLKTMNLVWDILSLRCLLDIQVVISSKQFGIRVYSFSRENHLLEELKILET